MKTMTHRLIGKTICQTVNSRIKMQLHESSFKFGCIIPDIFPNPVKLPHYKNKSFSNILEKIENIQEKFKYYRDTNNLKKFYVDLGFIIHYLADYFCFAHNNRENGGVLFHRHYERKLGKSFKKACLEDISSRSVTIVMEREKKSLQWIKDYINSMHSEYLSQPKDMQKDIRFSMEVCTTITAVILNNCLIGFGNEVA